MSLTTIHSLTALACTSCEEQAWLLSLQPRFQSPYTQIQSGSILSIHISRYVLLVPLNDTPTKIRYEFLSMRVPKTCAILRRIAS